MRKGSCVIKRVWVTDMETWLVSPHGAARLLIARESDITFVDCFASKKKGIDDMQW